MSKTPEKPDIVREAEEFYRSLCGSQGFLGSSASDDVAPGVQLKHLIDSQGWLPFIMIRTDEICKMLTGQRMWDAFYVSDPMALRGLSVADFESLSDDQKQNINENERPKSPIPNGAKSIIALNGLKRAISFKNDQCYLKNLPKAYFVNGLISEGECIPDIPIELFFAIELNKQTLSLSPVITQVLGLSSSKHEVSR